MNKAFCGIAIRGIEVAFGVNRVTLTARRELLLFSDQRTSPTGCVRSEKCNSGPFFVKPNQQSENCRSGPLPIRSRARRAGNAGAERVHESVEPERRQSDASAATETGQGFSDRSVIARVGALAADQRDAVASPPPVQPARLGRPRPPHRPAQGAKPRVKAVRYNFRKSIGLTFNDSSTV